jgi:hypothetical protein
LERRKRVVLWIFLFGWACIVRVGFFLWGWVEVRNSVVFVVERNFVFVVVVLLALVSIASGWTEIWVLG